MLKVYLDHMSTTPVDREVLKEMKPYLEQNFGNPSRPYDQGMEAREGIEKARERVADFINSRAKEVVFTSSGAEANNLAVHGLAQARKARGDHLVTSSIEHHSTLNAFRWLQKQDFVVAFAGADGQGEIGVDKVAQSITPNTTLVSIMLANYEVGSLQPIKEIAEEAHEKGALVHTDATAAAGNVDIDVRELGVDALTLSSHPIYGPKGAGALYLREGLRLVPLVYSGVQEGGLRGGTEDVPAIVGFGKACELAKLGLGDMERVRWLRDMIIEGVLEEVGEVELTGPTERRLPNHASFIVDHIDGEALMQALSFEGVYIGNGTACISQVLRASPVLIAMKYPSRRAQGAAIFTLGRINTRREVEYALEKFYLAVDKLRKISPFT